MRGFAFRASLAIGTADPIIILEEEYNDIDDEGILVYDRKRSELVPFDWTQRIDFQDGGRCTGLTGHSPRPPWLLVLSGVLCGIPVLGLAGAGMLRFAQSTRDCSGFRFIDVRQG